MHNQTKLTVAVIAVSHNRSSGFLNEGNAIRNLLFPVRRPVVAAGQRIQPASSRDIPPRCGRGWHFIVKETVKTRLSRSSWPLGIITKRQQRYCITVFVSRTNHLATGANRKPLRAAFKCLTQAVQER